MMILHKRSDMKMHLSFRFDDNNYTAEYQNKNGHYFIENIRIDFTDGIADIPIKSMQIHGTAFNGNLLWTDEYGNANLLINAFGNAIMANEKLPAHYFE